MIRSLHSHTFPYDLKILLNGSETLNETNNKLLFEIVQRFIKETKRFTPS